MVSREWIKAEEALTRQPIRQIIDDLKGTFPEYLEHTSDLDMFRLIGEIISSHQLVARELKIPAGIVRNRIYYAAENRMRDYPLLGQYMSLIKPIVTFVMTGDAVQETNRFVQLYESFVAANNSMVERGRFAGLDLPDSSEASNLSSLAAGKHPANRVWRQKRAAETIDDI
ncbi:hypothetical protein CMO88_04740 [Candidatus Woesearchaeota archaeon]|nr:hypothetical protein [Candidatus Woesearchaeota archaeon]|tara:strand:- start:13125 stop:13637 length:513 start_codon:yes stop_codon:yes gene_type:complete